MLTMVTRIIHGMEEMMSTMRMRMLSIRPPKYPATAPTVVPISVEMPMATTPTTSEMRPPYSTRVM